ncbi:hypothetical protein Aph01nite_11550 [Acrocarpospora phusangensis]|uniref:DUF998 domain-containing protein n=1 Tax=Acrocarpospora phusangensis TaxID=1070424 RepID=A0A919Q8X3_9ACTN|nr:DUF998 domain-containing protein [Acrocarpospora phusangensis]GIH22845.1 hypothetical protein Aph01nite_11550 [Acrocarpospora phusangensis]
MFALAGPVLFAALIAVTVILQYDWLVSAGQDPLTTSPVSVNAWGPYGLLQYAAFAIIGLSTLVLTAGLHRVPGGRVATLVPLALLGLALLAETARCDCEGGFTNANPLPGAIHTIGFFGLMLALLAATFATWWRLRRTPGWSFQARWSLVTGIALLPLFIVGDLVPELGIPGFYLFLILGPLQWLTILAWKLLTETRAASVSS